MLKVKVHNQNGEVVGEQELHADIFGVQVKPLVVQQVVVAQRANLRKPWAHTKVRSEVRGGGKKPWKQKGTGRARHGSIRSPLWRGGGVTFGPLSVRNYVQKINKKVKQSALRMILSDKLAHENLIVVETLNLPEVKTKSVATMMKNLPLKGRTSLFVTDRQTENFTLSSRNIPGVSTIPADSLNVLDLLRSKSLIIPVSALSTIQSLYSPKK